MRKQITKADKKFFKSYLGGDKGKAKSYTLTYTSNGSTENVLANVPYGFCVNRKRECAREPQFKSGTLAIKPNY